MPVIKRSPRIITLAAKTWNRRGGRKSDNPSSTTLIMACTPDYKQWLTELAGERTFADMIREGLNLIAESEGFRQSPPK